MILSLFLPLYFSTLCYLYSCSVIICSFCSARYCLYALYSHYLPTHPFFILLCSAQCLRTLNFPESIQRALLIGLVGSHQQELYVEGKYGEWMSLVPWLFSSFYWVVHLVFQAVVLQNYLSLQCSCAVVPDQDCLVWTSHLLSFLKPFLQLWVFC